MGGLTIRPLFSFLGRQKYYDNFGKGMGIIVNIERYEMRDLEERTGSEKDRQELDKLFRYLCLDVTLPKQRRGGGSVRKRFDKDRFMSELVSFASACAARSNAARKTNVIAVAVMGHGDAHGNILTSCGATIEMQKIFDIFAKEEFAGIPKLFIIQACRLRLTAVQYFTHRYQWIENFLLRGLRAQRTRATMFTHDAVPSLEGGAANLYSDWVVAHATMPDHRAYRDSKYGSPFIQILCSVFNDAAHREDLQTLLNMVSTIA